MYKNMRPSDVLRHALSGIKQRPVVVRDSEPKPGDVVYIIIGCKFIVTKPADSNGYFECKFAAIKNKQRFLISRVNLWREEDFFATGFRYDMVGDKAYIYPRGSKVESYNLASVSNSILAHVKEKGVDLETFIFIVLYKEELRGPNHTYESISTPEKRENHEVMELERVEIHNLMIPYDYILSME